VRLARKYEPIARTAAGACAANVSTVGKIGNQSPIHGGISRPLIGVVGTQCASCVSCACSPTIGCTRTLRAFHDRLAEHVKSTLGVSLTPHEFDLEVREPSAPPVDVAYAFDVAFSTIGWLIPQALFRRPIEGGLLRKARYEVEKNFSRLAAAWRARAARIIGELTREAEKQALDELTALERTLGQTASSAPELRKAVVELEEFRQRLCTPAQDAVGHVNESAAVPVADAT